MKPDFFLVGAPRSGTTALCSYLRGHPDMFMCSPKEPTYFGRDLVPKRYPSLESYLALFDNTGIAKRAGEGSVAYLASEFAAQEIHAFDPKASILIILREPVEMMYSLHLKHYLMGIEPCRTLREALAVENGRLARGSHVPPGVCPKVIALRSRATYVPQVKRFFELFGRAQVKVFLFDDFQANPSAIFAETCRFLGIRDDIALACERHNVGRQVKICSLHEFLTRAPRWAQSIARTVVPSTYLRRHLQELLVRRNQSTGKPSPIDRHLRARLRAEFAPDVAQLGKLIGRDLSHWSRLEYDA